MSITFSDTEVVFYDLDADTLASAAELISEMDEAGRAEWFPRFTSETTAGRVSNVSVTLDTRITLPHWPGRAAAPATARHEWDRFCAALRAHEQAHIDLVAKQLAGVDERMLGKSLGAAQREWERTLEVLKSASETHDRETDHGRNEGTILTLPNDAE